MTLPNEESNKRGAAALETAGGSSGESDKQKHLSANLMSIEALKLIERIAERVERIELRQTKIERKIKRRVRL